jgi:hypothetical protein
LEIDYDEDEEDSIYFDRYNATKDPPHIRLAYLSAMESSVVHRNSVESVDSWLANHIASLRLVNAVPDNPKPLVTLERVRAHLGLETDPFIHRQPICLVCYTAYSLEHIQNTNDPQCTYVSGRTRCKGRIWITKLVKNKEVRQPARYISYTRIIPALRCMLLRPSFVSALRSGNQAHSSHKEGVLNDICCGTAYQSSQIGLRRVFCADGSVRDEPLTPESVKKIIELGYGLMLAINIDWFRSTPKSIESTGAIYITIQNLDRTVRFLPANVILACIVPGPKEPPLEELNWVLQPIVDEIKKLYAGEPFRLIEQSVVWFNSRRLAHLGVVMNVFNSDRSEPQMHMVHGHLILTAADTPARCKCQGVAGHAHNLQFCRCNTEKVDINTAKGYDIDSESGTSQLCL